MRRSLASLRSLGTTAFLLSGWRTPLPPGGSWHRRQAVTEEECGQKPSSFASFETTSDPSGLAVPHPPQCAHWGTYALWYDLHRRSWLFLSPAGALPRGKGSLRSICTDHPGGGSFPQMRKKIKSAAGAALQRVKKYGHREPARRLVHPRVVSLALRAIHLLAIPYGYRSLLIPVIPKDWGIPTPVCSLARDDRFNL